MPRGALKSSLLLVGTLGMTEAPEGRQIPATLAIRSTPQPEGMIVVVQQWAKAWLEGDVEAMSACLHPNLVSHILGLSSSPDQAALRRLIGVQALLGKTVRDRQTEPEVRVLDSQGRSGSARVDLGPWTAFIHLAAHQKGWAIANVLWDWRS